MKAGNNGLAWYWWAGGAVAVVLILSAGGVVVAKLTRGIRNNNPGNLVHDGYDWKGKSKTQTDPKFLQFDTPFYGLRALYRTLINYNLKHGLTTIAQYINRYAPKVENQTQKYIEFVAGRVGKKPWDKLEIPADLLAVGKAIVKYENGVDPYSADLHALAFKAAKEGIL